MSEMVERVARAMWNAHIGPTLAKDDDYWRGSDIEWLERARIAIAALREPTEKVGDAGNRAMSLYGAHDCEVPSIEIFNAMIDAALKEDAG